MSKYLKIGIAIIFLLVVVTGIFGVGLSLGKSQAQRIPVEGVVNLTDGQPAEVDFALFWEAWLTIQERFAAADQLDYQNMVYGAISGMVSSLEDPYTVFLTAEQTDVFLDDLSGSFEGVGMEIGIRKDQLTVIAPLEGTPAAKAGLRAGDKIMRIDDASTLDITIEEAVFLIRGPGGTTVVLSILRDDWDVTQDFAIVRDVIQIPTLSWELLASTGEAGGKEGNVAYIKINHFSEKARFEFVKMTSEILNSDAEKIVLDVRNNPGGFLEVAVSIAGAFLERGNVVVIEEFSSKDQSKNYEAKGNAVFASYPVVILINEGSASASEILAGALRDNRGVQLVGKKSFGKGSVQELERLSDDSSLKITVANWLTPNGTLITGDGLEPDIEVELTDEDFEELRDPQLDKALELIKNL
ncbi:S41 family peptidase [Patescibacteria group bacterium]|nr:S41 family peptidase [Patescibacteria group bacterium]